MYYGVKYTREHNCKGFNMNNLVTVAIASYNNGAYVERCIDSVLNQNNKKLDIMIVDDGSKDETQILLDKYRDNERIRVILRDNGGLSSVRQLCQEQAKGEYICFVDADDYLM